VTEIREARKDEGPILAAVCELASLAALGHIFPPETYPYPREAVHTRWIAAVRDRKARRFYERRGWRQSGDTGVVEFPPNPLDIGYTLDF